MLQQLRPNAELDLLTQDELRSVVTEIVSGYLRPPQEFRHPGGLELDNTGAGTGNLTRAEAGMVYIVTRLEIIPDGYTMRAPWNPTVQGGIDLYVDGQWRDGTPFGGSSGYILPIVYTQSESRAVRFHDGAVLSIQVKGGPTSVGINVAVCGFRSPMPPVE